MQQTCAAWWAREMALLSGCLRLVPPQVSEWVQDRCGQGTAIPGTAVPPSLGPPTPRRVTAPRSAPGTAGNFTQKILHEAAQDTAAAPSHSRPVGGWRRCSLLAEAGEGQAGEGDCTLQGRRLNSARLAQYLLCLTRDEHTGRPSGS